MNYKRDCRCCFAGWWEETCMPHERPGSKRCCFGLCLPCQACAALMYTCVCRCLLLRWAGQCVQPVCAEVCGCTSVVEGAAIAREVSRRASPCEGCGHAIAGVVLLTKIALCCTFSMVSCVGKVGNFISGVRFLASLVLVAGAVWLVQSGGAAVATSTDDYLMQQAMLRGAQRVTSIMSRDALAAELANITLAFG